MNHSSSGLSKRVHSVLFNPSHFIISISPHLHLSHWIWELPRQRWPYSLSFPSNSFCSCHNLMWLPTEDSMAQNVKMTCQGYYASLEQSWDQKPGHLISNTMLFFSIPHLITVIFYISQHLQLPLNTFSLISCICCSSKVGRSFSQPLRDL